jgi:hypothetical protein
MAGKPYTEMRRTDGETQKQLVTSIPKQCANQETATRSLYVHGLYGLECLSYVL